MNKLILILIIAATLSSCSNSSKNKNNTQQLDSINIETLEELTVSSAYQIFSGAFTGDNVKINSTVLETLFPGKGFAIEGIITPMAKLNLNEQNVNDFEAYVFSDDFSAYLCLFSVDNGYVLKEISELYSNRIKDIEFMTYYGSRYAGVYMKQNSHEFPFYDFWVIDDNGSLTKISNLKHDQVPPEEQNYFFTSFEALLGNRYLCLEHSTDIVGSLYLYDIKTKSYISKYSSVEQPRFSNDTLFVRERGEFQSDSVGFAKYQVIEIRFVDGKLVEREVVGSFISN